MEEEALQSFPSTKAPHDSLFPAVGWVREELIKINIRVSDSLSNLNRRELGVAPQKEGTEQSLGRTPNE